MAGSNDLKHTHLYECHKAHGAKLVDFGGWALPASYVSVIEEHRSVREAVGLFDVSHMGEVRVSGPESRKFLEWLTVNDISRLGIGHGQYTAMLNPAGGMIDDLIIYRVGNDEYFICVNAANDDKDFQWISDNSKNFDVHVVHESHLWSQLAVQGPKALIALQSILSAGVVDRLVSLNYMEITTLTFEANSILVARTGYTGEVGFELYLPNALAADVWRKLMADSAGTGIRPIGLGARDTLRLEACYLLYGNDMNDGVSPIEAGIGWAVKKTADDFIGRGRVELERKNGPQRKIFAFLMEEPGIPRHGMDVYIGERKVGTVTSGSMLPTLDRAGGMALLDATGIGLEQAIEVDIRGKRKLAKTKKRPLYIAKVK